MQPKPGRIYDELPLGLARPRDKSSPAFEASTRRVLGALDRSLTEIDRPRHGERAQEAAGLWW
jgi:sulfonate transport system ATP-binding protein